jgi:hypothetical protein
MLGRSPDQFRTDLGGRSAAAEPNAAQSFAGSRGLLPQNYSKQLILMD